MNFASWTFVLAFLPLTLILFHFAGARRLEFLIAASALFYAWSGPWNAAVLASSILVNGGVGQLLTSDRFEQRTRKLLFWTGVGANLALLGAFKVAALDLSETDGFSAAERILIPLALSFVTFQQIGFITSCYRRTVRTFALRDYLFFILFFPQLVMGPIVRFQDIQAQLQANALARRNRTDVAVGLSIFSFGLAQKVLLADQLAKPVDTIFSIAQLSPVRTSEAWFATVGFQLQLYFDFAGYADMAIGLGRMFGMNLPINFDRPLFARDRFDLWRRWHITFVMFMRNHVFIPLAVRWRWPAAAALAVTGMLSGLWHGLGWTFIVWGLVQTLLLLGAHWRRHRWRLNPVSTLGSVRAVALTFLVTCLVGALFRAPTLDAAQNVYGALAGIGAAAEALPLLGPTVVGLLLLCMAVGWGLPNSAQLFRRYWSAIDPRVSPAPPPRHPLEPLIGFRLNLAWAVAAAGMLMFALAMLGDARRFIYVQF